MASVVPLRRSPRLARKNELAADPIIRQYKGQLAVLLDILDDLKSDFSDCASLTPEDWRLVKKDIEELCALCCGLLILSGVDGLPELRQLDHGCFSEYNRLAYQMENQVKLVRMGYKTSLTTLRHIVDTLFNGAQAVAWKVVKAF